VTSVALVLKLMDAWEVVPAITVPAARIIKSSIANLFMYWLVV